MQLIYRGYSSDYAPKTQRYIKPRAVNWRYQVPGETYDESSIAASSYIKPRAINWRYQTM